MMKLWITAGLCLLLMVYALAGAQEELPIEKIPTAKVDIVLVQDESGSMESTDPRGVRRLAADFLVDNLSIAGEGNNMALILFGTAPEQKTGLSRDFNVIRASARQGLEFEGFGAQSHLALETTPPRDYTDIFGALEMAYRILSESGEKVTVDGEEYAKEKLVLFLTDGMVDAWPGNLDRYGDIARDYLEYIKDFPPAGRYQAGRRYMERVADIDKERTEREIIERFKKKGWRIYPVGFSDGVDRTLLEDLAFGTYGTPGIARDYRELASILESVIPKAQNVIPLVVKDFCRTRSATGTTHIGEDIRAVLFKIDFSRMLEQDTSIRPENLLVILSDPNGGQIRSDQEGFFTFNADRQGRILTVTYFKEHPVSGTWQIEARGIGKDICGKIDVEGRRRQFLYVRLDPDKKEYWEDSDVEVVVSLLGEGRRTLPIRKVEGSIRTPSRETVALMFSEPDANNEARTRINLNKGTGEYVLMFAITDEEYGTEIRSQGKVIKVVPVEACVPIIVPEKIDLGVIGDNRSVTFEGIKVDVGGFPKAVDIKVKKPVLERGITAIPVYWVKVHPEQGVATSQNPFRFNIEVELPKEVPANIKDGIYRGNIIIESSLFQYPVEIPVEMETKFPRVLIRGLGRSEELRFDFGWTLGSPKQRTMKVGTTSLTDREIAMSFSPYIKNIEGYNEERINIVFKDRVDTLDMKIRTQKGKFSRIKSVAKLLETSLMEEMRIPPGSYTGELRVRGDLMREVKIPVVIEIPRVPKIKHVMKISLLLIVLSMVFLALSFLRFFRMRDACLFEGEYERSKSFRLGDYCEIEKGTTGYRIIPRTSSNIVLLNKSQVHGPAALSVGDNITIEEGSLTVVTYAVIDLYDATISIENEESIHGSMTGYFSTRILPCILALSALAWLLYWTIVNT